MPYFVYLLASRPGGALYLGATNDLSRRIAQHRGKAVDAHTAKYNITTLAWFETHATWAGAFERERRLKAWHRAWKIDLIMETDPEWRDICHLIPW
jgi:putative endonuclease